MSRKTIIKSRQIPRRPASPPGEVVLRQWDKNTWVVHFHNYEDGGYHQGDYCNDLAAAEARFEERVRRELGQSPHQSQPKIYDLGMSDTEYANLYNPSDE
jgi:hypothetical protein